MYAALRIFLLTILASIAPFTSAFSLEADDLTYDVLVNSSFTDHVQYFQKLFQHTRVHSFLEFGVGHGTKYFLDNCEEVTSCEILLPNKTTQWFEHTKELFQGYSNWTLILKRAGPHLFYANEIWCWRKVDPALHDTAYLYELKEICDELFQDKQFDVAFVDPSFYVRCDLVNELFDRVPIIVAHDTNAPTIYGWEKVRTPPNYEKIVFTQGEGVTFWVRNDRTDLIFALTNRIESKTESKSENKAKNTKGYYRARHIKKYYEAKCARERMH